MWKKKKLGLALGSGGSRGVAHIGFLQALDEAGIKPDFLTGCSMGSVVGAAYAAGIKPMEIREAVCKLKPLEILNLTVKPGGLFDTKRMRKFLAKYVGEERMFEQLEIPFACVAVDMYSQSIVTFSQGNLLDGVVASSCIPAIFKPIEQDGMRLVDGGILERVPARLVKDMGADKVVAVDVLGQRPCDKKNPTAVSMLLQMIDLMDNYRTKRRREENGDMIDLWVEPDLGRMSQYSFKHIPHAYDQGYLAGKQYAPQISEMLK